MKCIECNGEMKFITCNDDPDKGFTFNIYHCDTGCGMIAKENVWDNKGILWIPLNSPHGIKFIPTGKISEIVIKGIFKS